MLASPPAGAVDYIADPAYGGADRTALGGYTNVLGIDAVAFDADGSPGDERYVLGQRQGGADPRPVTVTRFDEAGDRDTAFSTDGEVTVAGLPANTTVTHLVVHDPGSSATIYVVGKSGASVVIAAMDVAGAPVGAFGTGGVATIASGLAGSFDAGFTVVDVELSGTNLVIATQAVSTSGDRSARVIRVDSTGALDAGFGTGGVANLPTGLGTGALSIGGITVLANTNIVGTAQIAGSAGADSQSVVFALDNAGAALTGFGGTGGNPVGQSSALETVFETGGRSWTNEALGDAVEAVGPAGNVVISGRAGTNLFLARVDATTGAIDVNWGAGGVSPTTLQSNCSTGQPELAVGEAAPGQDRYWLTNDCGNIGEVFRFYLGGSPDTTFGEGGAVRLRGIDFGYAGSVSAEPITFTAGGPVVGAGTTRTVVGETRYDAASWRLAQVVPPTAPAFNPAAPALGHGSVAVGAQQTFTANFTGSTPVTIRWESRAPSAQDWTTVTAGPGTLNQVNNTNPGESMLTVLNVGAAQHGTQYRAVATNVAGTATSSPATLLITDFPTITTQPLSERVFVGADNTPFTIAFTGTPTPTVQWQTRASANGNWANVSNPNLTVVTGGSASTLTVVEAAQAMNGTQFRAILTNTLGTVTTNAVTLEVTGGPVINTQPQNQTADEGDDVTFSVSATAPVSPPLSYQWQRSTTGAENSFSNIAGATSASYTRSNVTGADDNTFYQVRITDAAGNFEYSRIATLTVNEGEEPEPTDVAWGDYDANGRTDIATYRNGVFAWQGGSNTFGQTGDRFVVGNFDEDPEFDQTVVRGNTWMIQDGPSVAFGRSTDIPVSGDFTGDGQHDIAVFRPSNGTWYYQGGAAAGVQHGTAGDVPVAADYNGDGTDEIAVFRPSNGTWYVRGAASVKYGQRGDIPVRGDWNGDGDADRMVFRPANGTWYLHGGANVQYGTRGDIPLAGDFDGDGTSDYAVYRPGTGTWHFRGKVTVNFNALGAWPVTGESATS